jgi:hypothetical protein
MSSPRRALPAAAATGAVASCAAPAPGIAATAAAMESLWKSRLDGMRHSPLLRQG